MLIRNYNNPLTLLTNKLSLTNLLHNSKTIMKTINKFLMISKSIILIISHNSHNNNSTLMTNNNLNLNNYNKMNKMIIIKNKMMMIIMMDSKIINKMIKIK